jgi:hypothetical protein
MDEAVLREVFDELFSALETLETQNDAMLQFLKDRGLVGDEDLTPFLESASRASSVRWRAVRIRMDHLLSKAPRKEDVLQGRFQAADAAEEKRPTVQQSSEGPGDSKQSERSTEKTEQSSGDAENKDAAPSEASEGNPRKGDTRAEESAAVRPSGKEAA